MIKLGGGKKTSNAAQNHKGLHVSYKEQIESIILLILFRLCGNI
jgi:hypothetical protein